MIKNTFHLPVVVDDRTGDTGNELLDDFLFNAGLVLIGFTTGI